RELIGIRNYNGWIYLAEKNNTTWNAGKVRETNGSWKMGFDFVSIPGEKYFVWADNGSGEYQIHLYIDSMVIEQKETVLTEGAGRKVMPRMFESNGKCYIIWESTETFYWNIFYAEVIEHTVSSIKQISNVNTAVSLEMKDGYPVAGATNCEFAFDEFGYIHAVWIENTSGTAVVVYATNWEEPEEIVEDIIEEVQLIPDDAFDKNPEERKQALSNKYEALISMIEANDRQGVKNKIEKDIMPKIRGDENSWVKNSFFAEKLITSTNTVYATSGAGIGITLNAPTTTSNSATLSWQITWIPNWNTRNLTLYWGTTTNYGNSIYLNPDSTSYTLTGLTPNTMYYYKLQATEKYSTDGQLATATATATGTFTTFNAKIYNVYIVPASPEGTSIKITWQTDPATKPYNNYVGYGTNTNSMTIKQESTSTTATTSHSCTLTGLTKGSTYYYYLYVTEPYVRYPVSGYYSFKAEAVILSEIQVSTTANSVTVTWKTNWASDSVLHYAKLLPVDEYGNYDWVWYRVSNTAVVTSHSITLSGLAASKEYRFRLSSTVNGVTGWYMPPDNYTTFRTKMGMLSCYITQDYSQWPVERWGTSFCWRLSEKPDSIVLKVYKMDGSLIYTIIVQPESANQSYLFWTQKLRDSNGATNNPLVPNTNYKIEGVFTKNGWTVNSGRIPMVYVQDTDNDGLPDAEELTPWEVRADIDGNGVIGNIEKWKTTSDPGLVHTDSDGVSDGEEKIRYKTDPGTSDTDWDGVSEPSDINPLQNTKLKVRISEIMACNWYWGSGASYKAKVQIDNDVFWTSGLQWNYQPGQVPHLWPNWEIVKDMPDNRWTSYAIKISLYVQRTVSEQQCDIGKWWYDGKTLTITYDTENGRWSGDDYIGDNTGYRHSDGGEDGNANNQNELDHHIWFDVVMNDLDNDGIPYWEEVNKYCTDPSDAGWVGYFVMDDIYPDISAVIINYAREVKDHTPLTDARVFHGTWTRAQLKNELIEKWKQGMVGAVLVGHAPPAYYFYDNNPPVWGGFMPQTHISDLYYEDLDGIWDGGDGSMEHPFRVHTGDVNPEIWIGQLRPTTVDHNTAVQSLRDYFTRAINYLHGTLTRPNKALVYIDDPWEPDVCGAIPPIRDAFREVCVVNTMAQTTPEDYINRLTTEDYAFVHLMAHGSPTAHFVDVLPADRHVTSEKIHNNNTKSFFYLLFSCSNAAYDTVNYIAGEYVFGATQFGLAAMSSSKVGGMLGYEFFYSHINRGMCLGTAWFMWWCDYGMTANTPDQEAWFGGMVFVGDPSLPTWR
ncbi:MAG: hypothetical protein QXD64_03605, partial [Thermoplasmata archaeon]